MKVFPSTIKFLKDLAKNNNREWFNEHKEARYEKERELFIDFAGSIRDGLATMDNRIPRDLPVSKFVYRIYRDIRFSKDKTPYKKYFSAAYSSEGRVTDIPGYYLHIQPGNSFMTSGLWHPDKEKLAAVRQEIDYNSEYFRSIVENTDFKKYLTLDQEDKLKRAPAGYAIDDPNIEYLRLKSFTATAALSDDELTRDDADKLVLERCRLMQPFMQFLHEALEEVK